MMNLIKNIKITKVKAGAASGATAVNSDAVDMSNYDGCLFVTTVATANAGNFLKITQGKDSAFVESEDLKGSKVVPAANGEVAYVDVYRPAEAQGKYLRASIVRTVATATGDIYAVQYNGRAKPEVNDIAEEIGGILLISPEQEAVT